jgi:hypothetical protein
MTPTVAMSSTRRLTLLHSATFTCAGSARVDAHRLMEVSGMREGRGGWEAGHNILFACMYLGWHEFSMNFIATDVTLID